MSNASKVPAIIEDHCLSYTAKYWGFYGTHWHSGVKCWLVGAVNTENGSTTIRHYNERVSVNEDAARSVSALEWETLKEGLTRPPTEEERDIDRQLLEAWEDAERIVQQKLSGKLPTILGPGRDPNSGGYLN